MADANIIAKRLNSARRVLGERGHDIDKVNKEIVDDNVALILSAMKAADKINKSKGSDVDWREIALFDPKGRKPDMATRRVESMARAVTVGVPVTQAEGRKILGLDEEVPGGKVLLGKETTTT